METYYLILVIILGILAVIDLTVGVANDAVNFLGPAVGSRVGSLRLIMIVASIGVVVGAVFSGGMMEVARKGIFHPDQFYFSEILFIFLAVMLTDVLLLDFFNTFGIPTSTTVSLVFAIFGSAVGVAVVKIINTGGTIGDMSQYINSDKALAIISGILISVIVAFIAGVIIQYIARVIFSFNYHKNIKYTSGLFGGFALTAILLFIILKGLGDTSVISKADKEWIMNNTITISFISFIALSVVLQLLHIFFRLNVFKLVVFAGTFGLALSFAGNDLVNFIGAPIAGLKSYQLWQASGASPDTYSMAELKGEIPTDVYLLIIAGLIMVVTIFVSRKTRTVVKTTIDLSRQDEGDERFGSSFIARTLVQGSIKMQKGLEKIIPQKFNNFLKKRYAGYNNSEDDQPVSFDLIRASVNLVIASILIASATSLKLPLSTTYVTFMVAMGTSLADGAWGRESAVFRITGVLTIIGSWFFTAFMAFFVAGVIAIILYFGEMYAAIPLFLIAVYLLYRSRIVHQKREKDETEVVEAQEAVPHTPAELLEYIKTNTLGIIERIPEIYSGTISGLEKENRKHLKKLTKELNQINKKTRKLKNNSFKLIKILDNGLVNAGSYSLQVFDYLRETSYCLNYITVPAYVHVNNVHNLLPEDKFKELLVINSKIKNLFEEATHQLNKNRLNLNELKQHINQIVSYIDNQRKEHIVNVNEIDANTRTTMLYLSIMHETKNMMLHFDNFLVSYKEFLDNLQE